jgi:hypothetical protein
MELVYSLSSLLLLNSQVHWMQLKILITLYYSLYSKLVLNTNDLHKKMRNPSLRDLQQLLVKLKQPKLQLLNLEAKLNLLLSVAESVS